MLAGFCLFAVAAPYWLLFVLCLPFIVVTLTILKNCQPLGGALPASGYD